MAFGNLFGHREDKTLGLVRSSVAAREKVENAADKLNATLDRLEGKAEITVKAFIAETKAARRDQA